MDVALDSEYWTEAFILGAGFSRSVSEAMPLVEGLSDRLSQGLRDASISLDPRSLETWLSLRAEPQPYLDAPTNLKRQAVFARASQIIAGALDEAIDETLAQPMRPWLGELLSLWHLHQSHVLTFNYDTLVECAFETMKLWDWRKDMRFQWGSLISYSPPGRAGSSYGEVDGTGAPHPSFRLWKLHGSTNWYWTPGDRTGASAIRIDLPGLFSAPRSVTDQDRSWKAPGRERLLVPPSALKSPYYLNPVTAEIWSQAYRALSTAHVITLIGYSMPTTDLTTVGMLQDASERGNVRQIQVVDYAPDAVVARLRQFIPNDVEISSRGKGSAAVESYVSGLLHEGGHAAIDEIRSCAEEVGPDGRTLVTWGDIDGSSTSGVKAQGRTASVIGCDKADQYGRVRVITEQLSSFEVATRSRSLSDRQPMNPVDLARCLAGVDNISVAVHGIKREFEVIAATTGQASGGAGNGTWLQLIPAGHVS